jgi:DNA-binding NarL/FixJ family response regulator
MPGALSVDGTLPGRVEPGGTVSANAANAIGVVDVVIVSDVRLLREALAESLRGCEHIWVAAVTPLKGAVPAIAAAPGALALVDLNTPNALSLVRAARREMPDLRVVAFAVSDCEESIISCAEAGVHGFVCQDGSITDIVDALHSAVRGELRASPHVAAALFRRLATIASGVETTTLTLTRRQREIARCIDRGLSNKEIARELGIQLATVKNHVHSLLDKLGAARRSEAAARVRATDS